MQYVSAYLAGKEINIVCSVSRSVMSLLFYSDARRMNSSYEESLPSEILLQTGSPDASMTNIFLLPQYLFSLLYTESLP